MPAAPRFCGGIRRLDQERIEARAPPIRHGTIRSQSAPSRRIHATCKARGVCGLAVVDRAGRAPRPGLSVGYRRDQAAMGASIPGGLALRPGSVSEVRDSACSRVGTGDEQSRSGRRAVSRACWNSSCAGAAESQRCVPGARGLRLAAVWIPASATSVPGSARSGRNDNRHRCSFALGRGAGRSAGVGSRMRGSEE